jgi:hypothetical protein
MAQIQTNNPMKYSHTCSSKAFFAILCRPTSLILKSIIVDTNYCRKAIHTADHKLLTIIIVIIFLSSIRSIETC